MLGTRKNLRFFVRRGWNSVFLPTTADGGDDEVVSAKYELRVSSKGIGRNLQVFFGDLV